MKSYRNNRYVLSSLLGRQIMFPHSRYLDINANDSAFETVFASEYADILK